MVGFPCTIFTFRDHEDGFEDGFAQTEDWDKVLDTGKVVVMLEEGTVLVDSFKAVQWSKGILMNIFSRSKIKLFIAAGA